MQKETKHNSTPIYTSVQNITHWMCCSVLLNKGHQKLKLSILSIYLLINYDFWARARARTKICMK